MLTAPGWKLDGLATLLHLPPPSYLSPSAGTGRTNSYKNLSTKTKYKLGPICMLHIKTKNL